jgi:hypothetical protein
MPQAGLAPGVIDVSSDLSLLLTGLVALLWFAAGVIAIAAVRDFRAKPPRFLEEVQPTLLDERDAA